MTIHTLHYFQISKEDFLLFFPCKFIFLFLFKFNSTIELPLFPFSIQAHLLNTNHHNWSIIWAISVQMHPFFCPLTGPLSLKKMQPKKGKKISKIFCKTDNKTQNMYTKSPKMFIKHVGMWHLLIYWTDYWLKVLRNKLLSTW